MLQTILVNGNNTQNTTCPKLWNFDHDAYKLAFELNLIKLFMSIEDSLNILDPISRSAWWEYVP